MASWFSKSIKAGLVLGLVAFLFVGFFGMSHQMTMGPDGAMTMSNCPFMSGQAVVCNMNPLEHIAAWQSMFASVLQPDASILILLLLAALSLALLWPRFRWSTFPRMSNPTSSPVRREYFLPPPLFQELFSNGILNPKLF